MTRLTEDDVRDLTTRLVVFERDLHGVAGLSLRQLAQRTVDLDRALGADALGAGASTAASGGAPEPVPSDAYEAAAAPPALTEAADGLPAAPSAPVPFDGARIAAVPLSTGEGMIPGFCECVAAVLRHLGCDAHVTSQPDVRGLQEAAARGDEVVFVADDFRFIALNLHSGVCVDDDPATADGYVTALAAAAGGLASRPVLLLGLGPVGRAAGRRLTALGAELLVVDPSSEAVGRAAGEGLEFTRVSLADGLARCDLLFDATPAADFVAAGDLRLGAIVAAPGVPPALDAGARAALGARHIHEPLAVGVVVMAARALA